MEGFKAIPYIFLAIAVAAIVGGVSAVVQGEFGDSLTNKCYNNSYVLSSGGGECLNSTATFNISSGKTRNFSDAYNVIFEGKDATATVAGQLSTVAIIGIMVIIIGLLAGVFVYFKQFR